MSLQGALQKSSSDAERTKLASQPAFYHFSDCREHPRFPTQRIQVLNLILRVNQWEELPAKSLKSRAGGQKQGTDWMSPKKKGKTKFAACVAFTSYQFPGSLNTRVEKIPTYFL